MCVCVCATESSQLEDLNFSACSIVYLCICIACISVSVCERVLLCMFGCVVA